MKYVYIDPVKSCITTTSSNSNMMTTKFSYLLLSIHISLLLFNSIAFAQAPPPPSQSPTTICNSTLDPSYCKSVLPNKPSSVYDYGRFSVRKSLWQSRKFLSLIQTYLRTHSTLTVSAIRALQDCQYLASQNIDYLQSSIQSVANTNQTLTESKADDVQTYLSAILTNQQTCSDGLQSTASAWSARENLTVPLSNDMKLYSMSLALFKKGWVGKKTKRPIFVPTRQQQLFKNGKIPLKMSEKTKAIYEKVGRRKLLQIGSTLEVDVSIIVTVSSDGTENYTSINDAIAAAPNNTDGSNGYFLIYITAGVYEEYVNIPKNKKYLMIMGAGINQTIITGDRNVVDGWTTFNSATFIVGAPNFVGIGLTIRNTAGAVKHQAVALRVTADLSTFYLCSFEGYQDTLYTHSLRQFYRECDVYGTVDFIFGNAAVVLQNCNLYPTLPMNGQFNAITAQGRSDPNQNTGTSIQNCTIQATDDLASATYTVQTYLGRPWKEYSRTVYMQSSIGSVVNPAGWQAWNGDFALSTLYYAEYNNTGPGSDTTNRVAWAGYHVLNNATDAAVFTVSSFLLGDAWLPQTGIPYAPGL